MGGQFFLLCREFENYIIKDIPKFMRRVRKLRIAREQNGIGE